MARMAACCVRLRRSLLPRTSRFQASKRAPRNSSSSSRSAWIIVPMAPSSTKMRSAAKRRSADSELERDTNLFIALRALFLRDGERELMIRPQPEQMTDRIDKVGAVHGVKMEVGDAVIDQVDHLFGGDRGGDQLAGRRIVIEAVEAFCQPVRDGSAGAGGEIL